MAFPTSRELRALSDEKLAEAIAGYKPGTEGHTLCVMELHRRQNAHNEVRGWVALVVSGLALVVSVIALLVKR